MLCTILEKIVWLYLGLVGESTMTVHHESVGWWEIVSGSMQSVYL